MRADPEQLSKGACMACPPVIVMDGGEGAVREVAQVYELIKAHRPLLLYQQAPPQLAQTLLDHALRALGVALSAMATQQPAASASSPGSAATAAAAAPGARTNRAGRSKRTRSAEVNSRVIFTTAPYDDGYMWRKYGEKKIQDSNFTRCYFRCTYKDETGCTATKRVQQKNNDEPPMFQVTHHSEHTCNLITTAPSNNNIPFPEQSSNSEQGLISRHLRAKIKQVQQPLPTLAEVSTQEPFPVSDNHHLASTTDGAPNASGVPFMCNAYQLEKREDHDPFYNLERFLLHDSSEYY
ncbi:hypothetical protein ACP4OV_005597 [Aristida adscensionis]